MTFCTHCGANLEETNRLKKVLWAAQDLIHEGAIEDNLDGVVSATDRLMVVIDDYAKAHGADNPKEADDAVQ